MNTPFTFEDQETLYTDMQQLRDMTPDDDDSKSRDDLIKEIKRLRENKGSSNYYNSSNPESRHNMFNFNNLQNNGDIYSQSSSTPMLNLNVFIECANGLLKKDDDNDDKFIEFFKNNKISDYKDEHYTYIEDKVSAFLKLEPSNYENCLKNMNNYKNIVCKGGIINASMYILSNIFTFFIKNIDIYKIQPETDDYKNLKRLYDIFLTNINSIVKKTIDISKYFENKLCGKLSTTTTLADLTYNNIFDKECKNSSTVDYKLFDKVNLKVSFLEKLSKSFFGQIIIFIAIAYIFIKLINMLN